MGDLLRIDLTTRTCSEETVPPQLVTELIGAKGVGTHYLCEEVGADVDPLGPANKLIFCVGPMGGTSMLGGNRYAVYFASPLTGGYGECYSGGNVTPQFARTGYKVVIVEGKADAPVYLEISEEGAAFHDASDLWGTDAYAAEDAILARTRHKKAQACVIGQAGERLVRFACVNNNNWHQLGPGRPRRGVREQEPQGHRLARRRQGGGRAPRRLQGGGQRPHRTLQGRPRRGRLPAWRHAQHGPHHERANAFPTQYWRRGTLENFERITVDTMLAEHGTVHETCPPCVFKCVKRNSVFEGRHKGLVIEGPEYETAYVFGGLCWIDDFAEIMWLNDICDRYGVDTMSAGNLCALAIECSQRGIIDEKLGWNDPVGVGAFLEKLCLREGIGDIWAEGILAVEKEYGLEGLAVHVQGHGAGRLRAAPHEGHGPGVRDHDARRLPPARHHVQARDHGHHRPPGEIVGKAAIYCDWEDRLTIMDTLIYCRFYRDMVQWPYITAVVNAAMGADYTPDDLHGVANRIVTMTRDFNLARGIGRETERLPKWVSDTPREDTRLDLPAERDGVHARRVLRDPRLGPATRLSAADRHGAQRPR